MLPRLVSAKEQYVIWDATTHSQELMNYTSVLDWSIPLNEVYYYSGVQLLYIIKQQLAIFYLMIAKH